MSDQTPGSSHLGTPREQHNRHRNQASHSHRPAVSMPRAVPRPPAVLRSHQQRHRRRRHRQAQVDTPSWLSDQPTAGEMEDLFLSSLAKGLPEHFSLRSAAPVWLLPRVMSQAEEAGAVAEQLVALGSRSDSGYWELFGSWSAEEGYQDGLIVATLRRLEPQLNPGAALHIARTRGYLAEAVVARRERLSAASADTGRQQAEVYQVRLMSGTLRYLESLLDRLTQRAAVMAPGH